MAKKYYFARTEMETKPLISIIIPVFNVEKYIKKCLESVTKQTLSNIEILCIDDKGSDNSINIVQSYAKQDNRILIIAHDKNKGPGIARNTALKQAKGEYVFFIDSDDFIDTDFLKKLYIKAHEKNLDVVKGNVVLDYPSFSKKNNFNALIRHKLSRQPLILLFTHYFLVGYL